MAVALTVAASLQTPPSNFDYEMNVIMLRIKYVFAQREKLLLAKLQSTQLWQNVAICLVVTNFRT
jgi:hypothetical protein